ncbi:hypothetical protein MAPG_09692 [Magnaporthiopsis poae ATCC 64411]|uniref:Tyrosine specific protein phosphatases domain-containing protein n=1 Tax=Magnaporthiopsis poae (strain ATCC 64411 / 73-15) TaxID=644358 RepID=A0A0C4EAL7_MAGP6|nr:hypothetical protein MAPG_09692 [Magnaporthiopsis poae ATCC 64411]
MSTPDQLAALALADVREPIPPAELLLALGSKPFIHIPGTFNTRDLGLIPITSSSSSSSSSTSTGTILNKIRPGFVFRSGSLERLTPEGAVSLSVQLGVRRIFDLRSEGERAAAPDPDLFGVRNTWAPTEEKEATVELAAFYSRGWRPRLRGNHVRDNPEEPFLFHCTAGRDRTGVLAGLLATLAGQDPTLVELDYMLSRVGVEPAREMLLGFVMQGSGAKSKDDPGFYNLASLRPSSWRAFLDAVAKQYDGGLRGYARDVLGFSDDELRLIAYNLSRDWTPPPPPPAADGA